MIYAYRLVFSSLRLYIYIYIYYLYFASLKNVRKRFFFFYIPFVWFTRTSRAIRSKNNYFLTSPTNLYYIIHHTFDEDRPMGFVVRSVCSVFAPFKYVYFIIIHLYTEAKDPNRAIYLKAPREKRVAAVSLE